MVKGEPVLQHLRTGGLTYETCYSGALRPGRGTVSGIAGFGGNCARRVPMVTANMNPARVYSGYHFELSLQSYPLAGEGSRTMAAELFRPPPRGFREKETSDTALLPPPPSQRLHFVSFLV